MKENVSGCFFSEHSVFVDVIVCRRVMRFLMIMETRSESTQLCGSLC